MSLLILSNVMNIVTNFVYTHSLCQNESSVVIQNYLFTIFMSFFFCTSKNSVYVFSSRHTETHINACSMERALMRESF